MIFVPTGILLQKQNMDIATLIKLQKSVLLMMMIHWNSFLDLQVLKLVKANVHLKMEHVDLGRSIIAQNCAIYTTAMDVVISLINEKKMTTLFLDMFVLFAGQLKMTAHVPKMSEN